MWWSFLVRISRWEILEVLEQCDSCLEWQRRRGGGIINESLDIVESGEKMMEWPDTDDEVT